MELKINRSEFLFYLAYIMWISVNILELTYYRNIEGIRDIFSIINIPIYSLLLLKMLLDNRYSFKTICFGVIAIIVLIVSAKSQSRILLEIILFVYSARNIPIKKILKVTLNLQIILTMVIVISSILGIIENDVWYRDDGQLRYGLGYRYTSYLSNFFFHMILMYAYIKDNKKISFLNVILILVLNEIIYRATDTRAVYYLIILLVILIYIFQYSKINIQKNIFFNILFKYCFIIFAFIAIYCSINFDNSNGIYRGLNEILSGRLDLGRISYEQYGIPILGQFVQWATGRAGIERGYTVAYRYVDSSYLNIAINYGIIFLALICIGFTIIMINLVKKNKVKECVVLLFLAIHSITDPQLIQLQYNPFLLMLGAIFYEKYRYIGFKV